MKSSTRMQILGWWEGVVFPERLIKLQINNDPTCYKIFFQPVQNSCFSPIKGYKEKPFLIATINQRVPLPLQGRGKTSKSEKKYEAHDTVREDSP